MTFKRVGEAIEQRPEVHTGVLPTCPQCGKVHSAAEECPPDKHTEEETSHVHPNGSK